MREPIRIGIDIDSTINKAHFFDIIHGREFCKDMNFPAEENLNKCKVKEMFGLTDELYNEYMRRYFPWNCKYNEVEVGAAEAIRILRRNGNQINIITARDENYYNEHQWYTGKMMVHDTKEWFARNQIPYDNIFFCPDKLKICKENEIDVMVDDDPENIIELSTNGIPVIIAGQSYNEYLAGEPNVWYCRNWVEILDILTNHWKLY
jgi:uncharacterized HAD superfamily protein